MSKQKNCEIINKDKKKSDKNKEPGDIGENESVRLIKRIIIIQIYGLKASTT